MCKDQIDSLSRWKWLKSSFTPYNYYYWCLIPLSNRKQSMCVFIKLFIILDIFIDKKKFLMVDDHTMFSTSFFSKNCLFFFKVWINLYIKVSEIGIETHTQLIITILYSLSILNLLIGLIRSTKTKFFSIVIYRKNL